MVWVDCNVEVRQQCGMTLDELAVSTGLTKSYLSKVSVARACRPSRRR